MPAKRGKCSSASQLCNRGELENCETQIVDPIMPTTLDHPIVPIADLRPYPGNPPRGDLDALNASLQRSGLLVARYETLTGAPAVREVI